MILNYPAIFYKGDGYYSVVVPDLPGCFSGGESLEEAIMMGTDAASGWVLVELENGNPVPKASPISLIRPELGGFVSMIVLDIETYAEKYGHKVHKKNLTIPAWLNTFAEAKNINFSKVLQDSLTTLYESEKAV